MTEKNFPNVAPSAETESTKSNWEKKAAELEQKLPPFQASLRVKNKNGEYNAKLLFSFMAEAFGKEEFKGTISEKACQQWLAQFGGMGDMVAMELINKKNPKAALQEVLASGDYKKMAEGENAAVSPAAETTPGEKPAPTETEPATDTNPDEVTPEPGAATEPEEDGKEPEEKPNAAFVQEKRKRKEYADWGAKKLSTDFVTSVLSYKGFEHLGAGVAMTVANMLHRKFGSEKAEAVAEWLETNTDAGKFAKARNMTKKGSELADIKKKHLEEIAIALKESQDEVKALRADETGKKERRAARGAIDNEALKAEYDAFKESIKGKSEEERAEMTRIFRNEQREKIAALYEEKNINTSTYYDSYTMSGLRLIHERFAGISDAIENNQHLTPEQRDEAKKRIRDILIDAKAYTDIENYDAAEKIKNAVEDYAKYSEQRIKMAKDGIRSAMTALGFGFASSVSMMALTPLQKYFSLSKTQRAEQGMGANLSDLASEKYKKPFWGGAKMIFGKKNEKDGILADLKRRGKGALMAGGTLMEMFGAYGGITNVEHAFDAETYANLDNASLMNGVTMPIQNWTRIMNWFNGESPAATPAAALEISSPAPAHFPLTGEKKGILDEQRFGETDANQTEATAEETKAEAPEIKKNESGYGNAEKPTPGSTATESNDSKYAAEIKQQAGNAAETPAVAGGKKAEIAATAIEKAQTVEKGGSVWKSVERQIRLEHPEKTDAEIGSMLAKALTSEKTVITINGKSIAESGLGIDAIIGKGGKNEIRIGEPGDRVIWNEKNNSIEIKGKAYVQNMEELARHKAAAETKMGTLEAAPFNAKGTNVISPLQGRQAIPLYEGLAGEAAAREIGQFLNYEYVPYDDMTPTAQNEMAFERQMDQIGDIYQYVARQSALDPKLETALGKALVYDLLPKVNARVAETADGIVDANRDITVEFTNKGLFNGVRNMFRGGPDLAKLLENKVQNDLATADFKERLAENPALQGLKAKGEDLLVPARRELEMVEGSAKETQAALEKYVTEKSPSMAPTDKAILARRIDELAANAAKRGAPAHTIEELKAIKAKLAIVESKTDNGQGMADNAEKKTETAEAIPVKKEAPQAEPQAAPIEKPAETPAEKVASSGEIPAERTFEVGNEKTGTYNAEIITQPDGTISIKMTPGDIQMKDFYRHGTEIIPGDPNTDVANMIDRSNMKSGYGEPSLGMSKMRMQVEISRSNLSLLNDKRVLESPRLEAAVKNNLEANLKIINQNINNTLVLEKNPDGTYGIRPEKPLVTPEVPPTATKAVPTEKAEAPKAEATVVSETPTTESFVLKNGDRSTEVTFDKNPKSGKIEMELKGNGFHGSRLLDPESDNEATNITPYLKGPTNDDIDKAMDRIRAYQEILNDKAVAAHPDYVDAAKDQMRANLGIVNNALEGKKAVLKNEDGKWVVVLE